MYRYGYDKIAVHYQRGTGMFPKEIQNSARQHIPRIKICGLTRVDEALGCVQRGADAVGFVFFRKSPRCVTIEQAAEIIQALPEHVAKVGVFVNESCDAIMSIANACDLTAVQLHGQETPEQVQMLRGKNLRVIKALFTMRAPGMKNVSDYNADAYLLECGKGRLPGGNAQQWNWAEARPFAQHYPCILAGGLSPDNIETAITAAMPDAVDVSSGVEFEPGRKDLDKVKNFIHMVNHCRIKRDIRRIFES
jgi:phosphoribosylanthranilate isomerase